MTEKPVLQVAAKAAIISPDEKVLIVREAKTGANNTKIGLWGLVGGRLEAGETFHDGLTREIFEETGLTTSIGKPLDVGEWHPTIQGVHYQIIAMFMLCHSATKDVTTSTEHDEYLWIDPSARSRYPMMEPDCFVVDDLVRELSAKP